MSSEYRTEFHMCNVCNAPFSTVVGDVHVPMEPKISKCSRPGCSGERYKPQKDIARGKPLPREPYVVYNYFSPIKQLKDRVWWENFEEQLEPFPDQDDDPEDNAAEPHVHNADICRPFLKYLWSHGLVNAAGVVILFLCLSADGFNPFDSGVYSITFIALRIMSYRAKYGYKLERIIIVGLVPGPGKAIDLQPYLDILVADLNVLANGVRSANPLNSQQFKMIYAYLLLTLADYPGLSEIHGLEGHASDNGCFKCHVQVYKSKGAQQKCCCRFRDLMDEKEDEQRGARRQTTRIPPPAERTLENVKDTLLQIEESKSGAPIDGVKFACALGKLSYYNYITSLAFDTVHCCRGAFKHIRNAMGGSVSNAEPKCPTPEVFSGEISELQRTASTKKYEADLEKWKEKCRLRQLKLKEIETVTISPEDLDSCDVRFRWGAMPGFGNATKSIFQRKGDTDIHTAVHLMTSNLFLYCIYPYCEPIFYSALVGIIEVWKMIIVPGIPKSVLKSYIPKLVERMGTWEEVAPFSCLSYFFHVVIHLLKMRIKAKDVQQYWMFFFERFVSFLNRICKSRKHPEANIAVEMGLHMYTDQLVNSGKGLDQLKTDKNTILSSKMSKDLEFDWEERKTQSVFHVPNRLREYRSRLIPCNELQLLCKADTADLSKVFLQRISTDGCEVYVHGPVSMQIHNSARTCLMNEPAIGSADPCIRKSGFRLKDGFQEFESTQFTVGIITRFLIVDKKDLFVVVQMYQLHKHEESTLYRVHGQSGQSTVIPAAAIGEYACFCPWTDRNKKVDRNYMCVLWKACNCDTHHL
jgi:hypothetical protein